MPAEQEPPDDDQNRPRVPVWFWMLIFMACCLAGFGFYVVSTLL